MSAAEEEEKGYHQVEEENPCHMKPFEERQEGRRKLLQSIEVEDEFIGFKEYRLLNENTVSVFQVACKVCARAQDDEKTVARPASLKKKAVFG